MQLEQSFAGISEADFDKKITEQGMSAREILEHLCECYQAVITDTAGGKHEWGTFTVEDKSIANLTAQFNALRAKAVAAALDQDEEQAAMYGFNYIALHDAYHVGQLALIRMATDPNWNPYSIYGE